MKKCVAVLLALAACSTTSILSTWKKPGLQSLDLQKVIVVVPSKDDSVRRSSEDRLVAALAPRKAVPSYTLVPGDLGEDVLRAAVKNGSFDGALVMRVQSVERETTWLPGTYNSMYGGFYGMGAYDPYMSVDTYVRVETSIYSLPDEQLVWAASSRTANPASAPDLVNEVVGALREELQEQGLTPMPVSMLSPALGENAAF